MQTEVELQFKSGESASSGDRALAAELMEVLPKAMNSMRCHLRCSRGPELTVPQFRVLIHLREGKNTNKYLAEKLGVSVPAMSRMVSALTERGLVVRSVCRSDRRENNLKLTASGLELVDETRRRAVDTMSQQIAPLPFNQKQILKFAFQILQEIFASK